MALPATGAPARPAGGVRTTGIEELLIWAYQAQLVGRIEGGWGALGEMRWLLGPPRSSDGVAVCAEAYLLGGVIPGTAWLAGGADVHPDALAVHAAVLSLDPAGTRAGPLSLRVMRLAEWGLRPSGWEGPVIAWQGLRKDVGDIPGERPRIFVDRKGNPAKPSRAWFCPGQVVDRAGQVGAARRQWTAWRGALALLAGHFRSHPELLQRWSVSDSLPPSEPWVDAERRKLDTVRKP